MYTVKIPLERRLIFDIITPYINVVKVVSYVHFYQGLLMLVQVLASSNSGELRFQVLV